MADSRNSRGLCNVCREEITTVHTEACDGQEIYVCNSCLEIAKQNFIWICMQCGSVHIRPKSVVLHVLADPTLNDAYRQCEHEQFIQGIYGCVDCEADDMSESVTEFMCAKKSGHC